MRLHWATEPRFFGRLYSGALETDAVVAFQDRLLLPTIAACDAAVPFAYNDRNMRDLVTTRFAGMSCPAECIKRFQKERAHEIWLKSPRLGFLHLFLPAENAVPAHGFLRE